MVTKRRSKKTLKRKTTNRRTNRNKTNIRRSRKNFTNPFDRFNISNSLKNFQLDRKIVVVALLVFVITFLGSLGSNFDPVTGQFTLVTGNAIDATRIAKSITDVVDLVLGGIAKPLIERLRDNSDNASTAVRLAIMLVTYLLLAKGLNLKDKMNGAGNAIAGVAAIGVGVLTPSNVITLYVSTLIPNIIEFVFSLALIMALFGILHYVEVSGIFGHALKTAFYGFAVLTLVYRTDVLTNLNSSIFSQSVEFALALMVVYGIIMFVVELWHAGKAFFGMFNGGSSGNKEQSGGSSGRVSGGGLGGAMQGIGGQIIQNINSKKQKKNLEWVVAFARSLQKEVMDKVKDGKNAVKMAKEAHKVYEKGIEDQDINFGEEHEGIIEAIFQREVINQTKAELDGEEEEDKKPKKKKKKKSKKTSTSKKPKKKKKNSRSEGNLKKTARKHLLEARKKLEKQNKKEEEGDGPFKKQSNRDLLNEAHAAYLRDLEVTEREETQEMVGVFMDMAKELGFRPS
jgi:hypothetical protein